MKTARVLCFFSNTLAWQGRDSAPYPESTPMAGDTTPTILGGPALKSTFQTDIFLVESIA